MPTQAELKEFPAIRLSIREVPRIIEDLLEDQERIQIKIATPKKRAKRRSKDQRGIE